MLDGNEQYRDVAALSELWKIIKRHPGLRHIVDRLLFIEQPFNRDIALTDKVASGLKDWRGRPPVIIDESDGDLASLQQALDRGYQGTSHKNCKGVFKGIANAAYIRWLQASESEHTFILSGEDLANVGPIALLQDLTVMAHLGIEHVERNGHHYFAGLGMLPDRTQHLVQHHHPDLYHPYPRGFPAVHIEDGSVQVDSLLAAPFGTAYDPDELWNSVVNLE